MKDPTIRVLILYHHHLQDLGPCAAGGLPLASRLTAFTGGVPSISRSHGGGEHTGSGCSNVAGRRRPPIERKLVHDMV